LASTPNGTACIILSSADCAARQGTYRGDGTSCGNDTCPRPTPRGACCFATDAGQNRCELLTAAECEKVGGRFAGNGTTCQTVDVCAPRGACCNPSISTNIARCIVTTRAVCANIGGTYQGNNSVCAATRPCPEPERRGACCVAAVPGSNTPGCAVVTAARCTEAQGNYLGDNSICRPDSCSRTCACDWDRDGDSDQTDLMSFITDWLGGQGDFDGDGDTDSNDLLGFIRCFTSQPPACQRDPGGGVFAPPSTRTDSEMPAISTPVVR